MNSSDGGTDFWKAVEPIVRRFIENIESPFVWTPLGLFLLCALVYPVTKFRAFLYLCIVFILLAFGADWVGRWQNRQTPPAPNPQESSYRDDVSRYAVTVQDKAAKMLESGKVSAARALIDKNLRVIDETLKTFPQDANFHALMGYKSKDLFQSSKNLLSAEQRQAYLGGARKSFELALRLDPRNAKAHKEMGDVLLFEGDFDQAIEEYNTALELTERNYPAAEDAIHIAIGVKNGEIPFDF